MNILDKNRLHYDAVYDEVDIFALVTKMHDYKMLFKDLIQTDTSWAGLYWDHFERRLDGAKVLELGAGNGLNALIMASFGAHVMAVDISCKSTDIINKAGQELGLSERIEAVTADFTDMPVRPNVFDFIVGKSFLHHLTEDMTEKYLFKLSQCLCKKGEARFFEPAVNSKFLDVLRWVIPVQGRPSSLRKKSFAAWKMSDPHPERDSSSDYYVHAGGNYFDEIQIIPIGGIERLHRLLPGIKVSRSIRRLALRSENLLPYKVRLKIARSQTIILRKPHG